MWNHRSTGTKNESSRIYGAEVELGGSFGDWLIKLGRSIKLQAQLDIRNQVKIRKEAAKAIEKKLKDFKNITKIYEKMERKNKKDSFQNREKYSKRESY